MKITLKRILFDWRILFFDGIFKKLLRARWNVQRGGKHGRSIVLQQKKGFDNRKTVEEDAQDHWKTTEVCCTRKRVV